jgi:hypothetical protein
MAYLTHVFRSSLLYLSLLWKGYYTVSYHCRGCPADDDPPAAKLVGSKHNDFEEAMLEIAKASSCDAFSTMTAIHITEVKAIVGETDDNSSRIQ